MITKIKVLDKSLAHVWQVEPKITVVFKLLRVAKSNHNQIDTNSVSHLFIKSLVLVKANHNQIKRMLIEQESIRCRASFHIENQRKELLRVENYLIEANRC